MRRPMRWYWALPLGLLLYCAAGALVVLLIYGIGGSIPYGPLYGPTRWIFNQARTFIGDEVAICALILSLATPPVLLGLLTFGWLSRGHVATDGYLRCLKCGYILKGLSAPRCPECGEPI